MILPENLLVQVRLKYLLIEHHQEIIKALKQDIYTILNIDPSEEYDLDLTTGELNHAPERS